MKGEVNTYARRMYGYNCNLSDSFSELMDFLNLLISNTSFDDVTS